MSREPTSPPFDYPLDFENKDFGAEATAGISVRLSA